MEGIIRPAGWNYPSRETDCFISRDEFICLVRRIIPSHGMK